MKNYDFTNDEIMDILGEYTADNKALTATACEGGGDGWGKDSNVGLSPDVFYIVSLVGYRAFDKDFVERNPRAKDMANNLVVRAQQVTWTKSKGITAKLGEPLTALVGGRALCGAGVCSAQDKVAAVRDKKLFVLSYKNVDKGRKNDDGSIRLSKAYTAFRIGPDDTAALRSNKEGV